MLQKRLRARNKQNKMDLESLASVIHAHKFEMETKFQSLLENYGAIQMQYSLQECRSYKHAKDFVGGDDGEECTEDEEMEYVVVCGPAQGSNLTGPQTQSRSQKTHEAYT